MRLTDSTVKYLVAERIRNFRIEQSLTQVELGEMLDVTFQQVQKYESGANAISIAKLLLLCSRTNTPLSYFTDSSVAYMQGHAIESVPQPLQLSAVERRIIECLREIGDRSTKQHLLDFCKSILLTKKEAVELGANIFPQEHSQRVCELMD